jgi:hypothetical protein
MRIHLLLLLASLSLAGVEASGTALKWETQELKQKATPQDDRVVGTFRFINSGNSPVKIISVAPSCNCTTAELKQQVYAPGEPGELIVFFNVGNLSGTQRSTVRVQTDESKDAVHTLEMQVEIPQPVKIQPPQVWWYAGEAITPKSVTIEFQHHQPVKILKVSPAEGKFATELRTLEAGKKYELIIRPTEPLVGGQGLIPVVITSDLPYERHRVQTVYAGVAQRQRFGTMPVHLDPGVVWWRVGEPPSSKTIRVSVNEKQELNFAKVEVIGTGFTTKLETIKPGKEYSLIVTPTTTSKSSSAFLQLQLDGKGDPIQKIRVKRPVVAIVQVIDSEKGSVGASSNLGGGNDKP